MADSGNFASTLKQQADIVRIVGEYVKLKRSGAQNYTGLCPFHSEKTPSFSVHATRQFFHCFGCGASGDVFSFVQKLESLTFPEAVRSVAHKLGVPLPRVSFNSPQEAEEARLRDALLEIHEITCAFFQEQLGRPEGAHAREYLHSRGLSEKDVQEFRIGHAPESGFLLRDRLRSRFSEDLLRKSGLFSWKELADKPASTGKSASASGPAAVSSDLPVIYSRFRNRLTFPIQNESGRVIAFTARSLISGENAGPKYLNSPETAIYSKSRVLFNLHRAKEPIRKLIYAILVEGQMDCISLYSAGIHNVIASSGTAFTEAQTRLLARFSRRIVVNFDPDTAGAAAAERTLGLLVSEDFEIKVVTLDSGLDPDAFIRQRGRDAYEATLRAAPKYFDFLLDRARAQFPVRTPQGKVQAVNYLLPHLHRFPSRIVRDELAVEMAHKLAIDPGVLLQELKHAAVSRAAKPLQTPQRTLTPAEYVLIRALASPQAGAGQPSFSSREGEDTQFDPARQVHLSLSSDRLHDGLASEDLLNVLLQNDTQDVTTLPLSEADRRLLAETLLREDEELTPELVHGAITALRRRRLEHQQRRLRGEILDAERRGDSAALGRLIREKIVVDRELGGAL